MRYPANGKLCIVVERLRHVERMARELEGRREVAQLAKARLDQSWPSVLGEVRASLFSTACREHAIGAVLAEIRDSRAGRWKAPCSSILGVEIDFMIRWIEVMDVGQGQI